MAWEERAGNRYYYRKRRKGRRVVSEYHGAGLHAVLQADQDQTEQARREAERQRLAELRAPQEAIDEALDQLDQLTRAITGACLILAGYHRRRGQWRKKRA